jgi:hypothetical protein
LAARVVVSAADTHKWTGLTTCRRVACPLGNRAV